MRAKVGESQGCIALPGFEPGSQPFFPAQAGPKGWMIGRYTTGLFDWFFLLGVCLCLLCVCVWLCAALVFHQRFS